MIKDIRLSVSFFQHRKTKKLQRALGDKAILSLIHLWARVAVEKPNGVLDGWDHEDIALEADYDGDYGEFVTALIKVSFIDADSEGTCSMHNWGERQGWVANSSERSDRARLLRMARTHKGIYKRLVNDGATGVTREQYDKLTAVQLPANVSLTVSQLPANDTLTPAPVPAPEPAPVPDPSPTTNKKNSASNNNADQKCGSESDEKESFYLSKKKRKLSGESLTWFESFWEAFDLKRGKAEAADSWLDIPGMNRALAVEIYKAAQRECLSRQHLSKGSTPKWGQGWLSCRRWEDEDVSGSAVVTTNHETSETLTILGEYGND